MDVREARTDHNAKRILVIKVKFSLSMGGISNENWKSGVYGAALVQDEVCAPVLRSVTNQIPEICQVFETLENYGRTWYVDYMMISFTFSTESWKECSMRLNAGKVPLKSLSEMSNVRRMVFQSCTDIMKPIALDNVSHS